MTNPLPPEVEEVVQKLEYPSERRFVPARWKALKQLAKLDTSHERIVKALVIARASDPDEDIRNLAAKTLLAPIHQEVLNQLPPGWQEEVEGALKAKSDRGEAYRPVANLKADSDSEKAYRPVANWYWWLWFSPLVTVPFLLVLALLDPGYQLVCEGNWRNCDYTTAQGVSILIAVLGSALWHLVLLFPALDKKSEFMRWHGRQALLLAGMRTAVPLAIGLASQFDSEALWLIPVQIGIWFFGTLWGQRQAARGDCSLMRWFGRAEALPPREATKEPVQRAEPELPLATEPDPDALVDIIRYSRDPEERRKALAELEKLGMVESQYEEEEGGHDEMP